MLDISREILHNKGIRNKLEAWLAYTLYQNMEKVMNKFSKKLDRNTVQYKIDEIQDEIAAFFALSITFNISIRSALSEISA